MSQYLTEDQLRVFMEVIKSDKELAPVIFTTQPTDLELRIRKDVMDAMEELKSFEDEFEDETEIYFNNLLNKVIDRLKLLWGE